MLRPTTLLIVMFLGGGPTGSLVCELWCGGLAAEDHHRSIGYHDASTCAPEGQQIAAAGGCHDAVAAAPFLTEARQIESGPAATDAAVLQLGSMTQDLDRVGAGCPVFQVHPPRGPSLHAVLRV